MRTAAMSDSARTSRRSANRIREPGEGRLWFRADWNWLPSMFVLADVCADLGEEKHAATLYRLLAPYSSRNAMLGYVYSYGSIAFVLGKLAALRRHFDDAHAHFEAALA